MKDLRDRCKKLDRDLKEARCSLDESPTDLDYIEGFAREIRNEVLEEARCVAVKLCKEHKIDYNLCEAISGRFRQLETAALAASSDNKTDT